MVKVGDIHLDSVRLHRGYELTTRDQGIVEWARNRFLPGSALGSLARQTSWTDIELFVLRCTAGGAGFEPRVTLRAPGYDANGSPVDE
jgi:hypothetical protein